MRVKIGDKWHIAEPGVPIMVELSEQDKSNIADMHKTSAERYAVFHSDEEINVEQREFWMRLE